MYVIEAANQEYELKTQEDNKSDYKKVRLLNGKKK